MTNAQRDALVTQFNCDGCAVLPGKLPADLMKDSLAAIDRLAAKQNTPDRRSVKLNNCVDADPAFRALMMYEPALQLCYDILGPLFQLNQSNLISRPREEASLADFVSASPWHADGPWPALFPTVNGVAPLFYLKFGYFLSDLTHKTGGSLQVVHGSHLRPSLDGKGGNFRIEDYAKDFIQFDCEPGTVVAFHQAQWHAAPPNLSDVVRKNVYISYCQTWLKPYDRNFPSEDSLQGLTPEERWLLGEPRPATRWWQPSEADRQRMARFKRD